MNLKSKSSVFQYIEYLIDHKLIFKDSLKARSIQIRNENQKLIITMKYLLENQLNRR